MKKEIALFIFCAPLLYITVHPILYGMSIIGGCFYCFFDELIKNSNKLPGEKRKAFLYSCLIIFMIFTEAILRLYGYFRTPNYLEKLSMYVPYYSTIVYFIVGFIIYRKYYRVISITAKPTWKIYIVLLPILINNITYSIIVPRDIAIYNFEDVIAYSFQTIFIAAVMEEIFFRGFLYSFFKKYISVTSATLLSSAIFALWHINVLSELIIDKEIVNVQNARQLLIIFLLGVVNCYAFEKTKSLKLPILYHIVNNGFIYIIIGYLLS